MPVLALTGCTLEPLLAYLKALGVFRVVAEQEDPAARGRWQEGMFWLRSRLDEEALIRFLVYEYRPTPIVACWNGGSGFFPSDRQEGIQAILGSTSARLEPYRRTIEACRAILKRLGLRQKPEGEAAKVALLRACRNELPDEAIPWLDAAYVLGVDDAKYPPLLGTGANDGRLEFTNNFMQRLCDVLPDLGGSAGESEQWLRSALFGIPGVSLRRAAVGQYHPGGVGGPNATQGFEDESLVNPWDFVLAMEGTLLFAGTVGRRYTVEAGPSSPRAAFPFTVLFSAAGYGTASENELDESMGRAELWVPQWHRWAMYRELAYLFGEGRAQWGRRQARTGADFARAVVSLGVDRGLEGFRRYGFLRRSGRSFLAAPLGYVRVRTLPEVELLRDVDEWLDRVRQVVARASAPSRLRTAVRRVEEAILSVATANSKAALATAFQSVLVAVWEIERELSISRQFRSVHHIPPFRGVRVSWWEVLDDGSPECRLAAAVGSVGAGDAEVGPLRVHLEPVSFSDGGEPRWDDLSTLPVQGQARVAEWMALVVRRRVAARQRDVEVKRLNSRCPPLDGAIRVSPEELVRFLRGEVDESRFAALLPAFSLVRWPRPKLPGNQTTPSRRVGVPVSFAIIKLLFLPWPVRRKNFEPVPGECAGGAATGGVNPDLLYPSPEPAVVSRLMAGDSAGAFEIALHRLRALGVRPAVGEAEELHVSGEEALRLAAALLIPVQPVRDVVVGARSRAEDLDKEVARA